MKQMLFQRRPQGWSRNPSQFPLRARGALLASLGALVCILTRSQLDLLPTFLPISFLICGVLALLGPNVRWRATPWIVALNVLIAFFGALLPSLFYGIITPALHETSAKPFGWVLGLIAAVMTGLVMDEWMASQQTLRRLGIAGRRVRRSFLGLSPHRSRRV